MFQFGIEHEVAFLSSEANNAKSQFADFISAKFTDFDQIVAELPIFNEDYPTLRVGDAGIKKKRWYIEGFERFQDSEQVIECVPKGIEIRTSVHDSIYGAIQELTESFNLLTQTASQYGFKPVLISFNPYHTEFIPNPPLNQYEIQRRQGSPEKQTANIPMLTYGPDLNVSMQGMTTEKLIDVGKKLTYYSPYIVPFSFSSPFFQGQLWSGLSVRTFLRTGKRPATMVFVENSEDLIPSFPSLTKIARLPAEVGRIEFKACDSCDNFAIYAGLLALLKGLILDNSLEGRSLIPNAEQHQLSAQKGFDSEEIFTGSTQILQAASTALANDPDAELLTPLTTLLDSKQTPAHQIIRNFQQTGNIEATLDLSY